MIAHRRSQVLAAAVLAGVLLVAQASAASAAVVSKKSADPTAAISAAQLKVVTIGDSIMDGHGLAAGQSWPDLISNNEGWTMSNMGADGAGVLAIGATGTDYSGIIAAASSLDPDIVIIEGSSNDFGESDSDLLAATIAEFREARTEFPNAQIVGLSTLWGHNGVPAQLADTDAQVKEAAKLVGGTYIDLGQPMFGHPELMQADNVHPNAAGQAVLASVIQAAIQPVIAVALEDAAVNVVRVARIEEQIKKGLLQ